MRSDPRALDALKMLDSGIAAYQARVREVAGRIRAYLLSAGDEPAREKEAVQLGEFAAGRIDMERFTALWDEGEALDHLERALVERAHAMLRDIAGLPREGFMFDLPPGGRLAGALGNAFADLGRAFGAMLIAELVRTRRYDGENLELIHGFPRYRWSRSERNASPPVVITLDGADLWAGEVAQYLDGNQKILLVVRPPAPPAALVRLITPGTLVLQTSRIESLAPVLSTEGPVVAALVPEGAAEFIHLPGTGATHERLAISVKPAGARKAIECWTTWQQQEELDQLLTLAQAPAPAASNNGAAPVATPADRLAAWLLSRGQPEPAHR